MSKKQLVELLSDGSSAYHSLVWSLFKDDPEANRDFVFRAEARHSPVLYVVSARRPNSDDVFMDIETKEYDPQISVGSWLGFDVRLNPVVTRSDQDSGRSRKHDVIMDRKRTGGESQGNEDRTDVSVEHAAVRDWLSDREDAFGFRLRSPNQIQVSGYTQNRVTRRNGSPIRFSSVDVVGSLEVTSEVLFRQALYEGIGRSKAFGCGLLLVRRL